MSPKQEEVRHTLLVEELDHRSLERGGIGRDLAVFQLNGQIDTPELRHPTKAFVALARRKGSIVRCLCTVSMGEIDMSELLAAC